MKLVKSGSDGMYFFDTYALYQIAKGAETYTPFQAHVQVHTTLMNLYELHYTLSKDGQQRLAELFFERLLPCCLDITPEDVKTASLFRLQYIKKKFSYVDALGYVIAQRHGLSFLTGDSAFENVASVNFIR